MAELTEIWKPLSVGPTDFKHRIMIAPHGQCYAENHRPSDRTVAYFRERAMGGVALQTIESTSASRYLSGAQPGGATSGWRMSAWEKDHIPSFALLADTVHEYGCKLFLELSTGGVNDVGRAWIDKWHPVWGPSRVPSPIMNEIPMTMEQAKIDELVSDYGTSAKNMLDAGLDGVEIHAAHGYLPMQYLSPIFNKRTDQYGGSAHNRARLTLEIGEKVRERVGTAISVGMRLSVDEYMGDAGIVPDLAEEYLEIFAASGLFDYFSISCGSWYSIHYTIPPMGTVDEAFLLPYGQRAKKIVGDRGKVFLSGRIRDLDTAERVVREGAADMVAMVRAHIADPYIVRKAQEGRSEEIIRCTGANECVAAPAKGRQVSCVMNPASGRERQWGNGTMQITPARKRVVVVGAGPAGMKVAGVAAKRGHQVVILEKERYLGGHLDLEKRIPRKGDWQTVINNLEPILVAGGVEINLGVEATTELLAEEEPDVIVCATGSTWDCTGFSSSRPERESIPGVEQDNVIDIGTAARMAVRDPAALGSSILILDETGRYLPLGLAELLGNAGYQVQVVSRFNTIGDYLIGTQELPWLLPRLAALRVEMSPGHFIERIDGTDVEIYEVWNKQPRVVKNVDTVVISAMRTPDDALYHELVSSSVAPVHRLGDAVSPRSVSEAIYEGEKMGREL